MKKFFLVLICMLIISPFAVMFAGCGTPAVYSIIAKTSDVEYGSVSGQGNFAEGTKITIKASPVKEANFLCWTLNNKVVSNEANYTFQVNKDTQGTYVALFDQRLDYYALTEIALSFEEGVQIQQMDINLQAGSSLSSLQTIYNISTNPVEVTQNADTVPEFYSKYLIHKKTTDTTYYCRLSAKASYEEESRTFKESFELDFSALYNDGIFETEERTLTGYGKIKLKFEKINKDIVEKMIGKTEKK